MTALIVLLGAAAWFLLSYYFVRADALRVVRCTTEELTVALESGDKAADFRLTCSDMYGNSYPATWRPTGSVCLLRSVGKHAVYHHRHGG